MGVSRRTASPLLIVIAVCAVVTMVVAVTVAVIWLIDRESSAPELPRQVQGDAAAPTGGADSGTNFGSGSTAVAVGYDASIPDPVGDGRHLYEDMLPYSTADITHVDIRCDGANIVFSVTFAPTTDMSVTGFVVVIDVEPNDDLAWRQECPRRDGEDYSFAVARAGESALLSFASCDAPYPRVASWTSPTVSGQILKGICRSQPSVSRQVTSCWCASRVLPTCRAALLSIQARMKLWMEASTT